MIHPNIEKFNTLCDFNYLFERSAGYILERLILSNGIDDVIKKGRWYAQIAECIINDDVLYVTDDEKIIFIDMHIDFVNRANNKQLCINQLNEKQ